MKPIISTNDQNLTKTWQAPIAKMIKALDYQKGKLGGKKPK